MYRAFVERARLGLREGLGFRASEREIAEHARTSHKTAHACIRRLVRDEMIELVTYETANGRRVPMRDKASGAYLWRFTDQVLIAGKEQVLKTTPLSTLQVDVEVSSGFIFNTSDASERGGTRYGRGVGLPSLTPPDRE